MSPDVLAEALRFASVGWPVHPCVWTTETGCSCGQSDCGSPGKHPLTLWRKAATTDAKRIVAWWTRWPLANVAIATGAPGPSVVDFDIAGGKPGMQSLAKLRAAGLLAGAVATVRTWTGGLHAYFEGGQEGNSSLPRHGVDFRGTGGYVVAPPSVINGRPYELIAHRAATGVTVNWAAIRRLLVPPRPVVRRHDQHGNHDALIRWVASRPVGARNEGLYWATCRAAETGADDAVYDALVAAAVSAGLSATEADRTVESARGRLEAAR